MLELKLRISDVLELTELGSGQEHLTLLYLQHNPTLPYRTLCASRDDRYL